MQPCAGGRAPGTEPHTPPLSPPTGALYGTYESFRFGIPGVQKIRYIGKTTVNSAVVSDGCVLGQQHAAG